MAKITLHGMFARVKGEFNKSETLYFKGCPCGKEQLGVDLLNPSKAKHAKNILAQEALKTAALAQKIKRAHFLKMINPKLEREVLIHEENLVLFIQH